ncbi:helix-turn-helix transcriptional regulator [Curtobacterium sp. L1-20]
MQPLSAQDGITSIGGVRRTNGPERLRSSAPVAPARASGDQAAASGAALSPIVAVAGTDTGTAIRDLAGMYAGRAWYSSHVDTDYWYKYVAVGDDQLSIRRSQMHGYLRGDVAVEGEVVVQWLDAGQGRVDIERDEVRMQPGVPTLFPVEQRFEIEYEDWDQRIVHLNRDLVLDVAAEQYLVDGTIAFDRFTVPTPEAITQWRRSVTSAMHALRSGGASSLVWHEAQRDIVRSLLALYRFQAEPLPTTFSKWNRSRLREAVDFIHAHAAEPLTVADIARAAGFSVRGLQEAFQRELDRTPMAYVREVRLRRTHAELVRADREEASVAEIASRWGFTHMGRFSREYVNRFGEYPKRTLRR